MRKPNLQQQAMTLIEQLPTEKLRAAIDYLTYLYDKEAWEATYELASDPEIVKSLERAVDDVKAGRLKSWDDVRRDI
jgi:PHD/YefM family antitoxin component YafN of YafNO toxin-antitoxin module